MIAAQQDGGPQQRIMSNSKQKSTVWLVAGLGVLLLGSVIVLWVYYLTHSTHQTSQKPPDPNCASSRANVVSNSLTEDHLDAMAKFLKANISPVDTTSMAEQVIKIVSSDPELRRLGCDSAEMRASIRTALKDPEISKQFSEKVLTEDHLRDIVKQLRVHVTATETKRTP